MPTPMNTGHDGSLTTLHANSPADVLARVVTMVRYGVDLPVDVIEANAASAFDLIVQTSRFLDGRRFISCVAELAYDRVERSCEVRPVFERPSPQVGGVWRAVPEWVGGLPGGIGVKSEEVEEWRRTLPCG